MVADLVQSSSDQLEADQDAPDQDAPDHEAPDQEAPDHEAPDHDAPDHEAPDQEAPDQEAPDHEASRPRGARPRRAVEDPAVPRGGIRFGAASADVSTALPKMSCSPVSALPLASTTCSEPRDASRLPVPLEVGHVCVTFGVGALSTAARFSSPLPLRSVGPYIEWVWPTSSAFTWSGVSAGPLARAGAPPRPTRRRLPATCRSRGRSGCSTVAVAPN